MEKSKGTIETPQGLKGLNSIGEDSYFIRLRKDPQTYIHFEGELNSKNVVYRLLPKVEGACIFHKEQADNFIKHMSNPKQLEIVPVKDVLGEDESKN